ncbi:MAG: hypothetical protein PUD20_07225 [bacterium]|nr:hypothetical protein [bacterium]
MKQEKIMHCCRRLSVTVLLFVLMSLCGCGARQKTIIFSENLDKTAVTIDGTAYPLRELAFYVAYEEKVIQEQALVYDSDNPKAYWNTHINGNFVRIRARNEAMEQAVHDIIFYNMAQQLGMELSEDEEAYARLMATDFWMDLGEEGQNRLGITEEELSDSVHRMAIAQKYQQLHAAMNDATEESFDCSGENYKKMLEEEHEYKVKDSIWKGIQMGTVTLDN